MNQQQQASNFVPPPNGIPLKKKRGRPRKDRNPYFSSNPTFLLPKMNQIQNRVESVLIPPGFEQPNGNQPQSTSGTVNDNNNEDTMVGKVVTGVIEAAFEAGYLLSVRVGESETSLRGIVFKPGHYIPVSAENDIAPTLQMIRRNELPFPPVIINQGKKRRGKQKTDHHGTPPSNQLARVRSKQMPIVAVQTPHPLGSRGTVVPVVLQPVSLSNGATAAVEAPHIASQPAHLAATKGKQVPLAQITEGTIPKGSQIDSGSGSQPFEELVSVAKRMQVSPESVGTQNRNGNGNGNGTLSNKRLPKDSGLTPEQIEDLSKPLLVKPLQAIRSGLPDQSAPLSHAFQERRTGKMTELLLAVQENLRERQIAENHQDLKSPGN